MPHLSYCTGTETGLEPKKLRNYLLNYGWTFFRIICAALDLDSEESLEQRF
jgi:hypothetical protein